RLSRTSSAACRSSSPNTASPLPVGRGVARTGVPPSTAKLSERPPVLTVLALLNGPSASPGPWVVRGLRVERRFTAPKAVVLPLDDPRPKSPPRPEAAAALTRALRRGQGTGEIGRGSGRGRGCE